MDGYGKLYMSYAVDLVPTLRVGMRPGRSASAPEQIGAFRQPIGRGDVPTRSVGTRTTGAVYL